MKVLFFQKYGFWLFFLLAGIHLVTLALHPLPWFDEVFFADVSDSLTRFGRFDLKMAPNVYKQEILFYGPVYFGLQSLVIKLFGLHAFSFRMLNFVSGLGLAWLVGRFLFKREKSLLLMALASLLMLADPVFGQNMHSGRMDLTAVFFAFWGFSLAFDKEDHLPTPLQSVWIGLIWALAFLTTPRIVFVLIPAFGLFFFQRSISVTWKSFFWLSLAFIFPVLGWIFIKVGGLSAYFGQFSHNNLSHHIGPQGGGFQWIRYSWYIPYYLGLLAVALDMWLGWWQAKRVSALELFYLAVAALFYVLVVEMGPYSAMVLPFYILLLFSHKWNLKFVASQPWSPLFSIGLLLVFVGLFFAKAAVILATKDSRTDQPVDAFISSYNMKGKKVVASFEYYYALQQQGAQYYAYELALAMSDRLRFHFDTLQFDYLLLNERDMRGHQRLEYENLNRMERIADLKVADPGSSILARLPILSRQSLPTMNGTLYKRLR